MARTVLSTREIGSVQRNDFDTTSPGQAVITKVVAGSGVSISSTGTDTGTGDVTITLTDTLSNKTIDLAAGTSSVDPLTFISGSLLTSPAAGAVEYDGVQFYKTIDTNSGRGAIPVEQYFHLSATGSTISSIANYFGSNSNISLVSGGYYEIEIYCFFLKTTAGTVTWTLTNSAAPTGQNIHYEMSPSTGIVAPPGTATMLQGQIYNDATAAKTIVTASLTNAANHYMHMKIFLKNGAGTSLKIQATCSAGTITPGIGSTWHCRRLSSGNVGTFAA